MEALLKPGISEKTRYCSPNRSNFSASKRDVARFNRWSGDRPRSISVNARKVFTGPSLELTRETPTIPSTTCSGLLQPPARLPHSLTILESLLARLVSFHTSTPPGLSHLPPASPCTPSYTT